MFTVKFGLFQVIGFSHGKWYLCVCAILYYLCNLFSNVILVIFFSQPVLVLLTWN